MKPTNYKETGCDPMSSNCVIWQGPDIECIELCKGDTISEVVAKLAAEFCTLLDKFDVQNYDLSCLNLAECAPDTFEALLQLMIEQICAANGTTPAEAAVESGLDTQMDINERFYYNNPQGDQMKTMSAEDYITAIGNKSAENEGQIETINNELDDKETRLKTLEEEPAPETNLPKVTPECVMDQEPQEMNELLGALEKDHCAQKNAIGTPEDIAKTMQAAIKGIGKADQLLGDSCMSSLNGWKDTPANMAESMSNLWKVVGEIWNATVFMMNNCCDISCAAVKLLFRGEMVTSNKMNLYFEGDIPNNWSDSKEGSTLKFEDTAGGVQVINGVKFMDYYKNQIPMPIDLKGVNGALDIIVTLTQRLEDFTQGTSCQNIYQTRVVGLDTCPTIAIVPGYTNVNFDFPWPGTPQTVVAELYDAAGTTLLQSQYINITSSNPSAEFLNLEEGTTYRLRLVIAHEPCDMLTFTTLEYPCNAPNLTGTVVSYTQPTGDVTGITQDAWQVEYDANNP